MIVQCKRWRNNDGAITPINNQAMYFASLVASSTANMSAGLQARNY